MIKLELCLWFTADIAKHRAVDGRVCNLMITEKREGGFDSAPLIYGLMIDGRTIEHGNLSQAVQDLVFSALKSGALSREAIASQVALAESGAPSVALTNRFVKGVSTP